MRKGNVSLRRCLSQAAWAISMMKNNYLSALYRRIAARRGAKRGHGGSSCTAGDCLSHAEA
jgi:transposase